MHVRGIPWFVFVVTQRAALTTDLASFKELTLIM